MRNITKKLIILVLIFAAISVAIKQFWYYTQPHNFPLIHIKIYATYEHIDKTTLQTIITPYAQQGFFYIRVAELKKQLLHIPWVYGLTIRREWPDTLVINIVEHYPIARFGDIALINTDGTIFKPPLTTFPQKLPLLLGSQERATEIFSIYQQMLTILQPLNLTLNKVVLHPEHFWMLILDNNTVITLKENDPLNQLRLLANVYHKIIATHKGQNLKYIDLRYKSGFAVKWE